MTIWIAQRIVHDDAVLVDRLVQDARSLGLRTQLMHAGIAGFFDRDRCAAVDEELGDQMQRLLRAGGDQDLVRLGMNAAPRQHLGADFLQQHGIVGFAGIGRPVLDFAGAEREAVRFAPSGAWK